MKYRNQDSTNCYQVLFNLSQPSSGHVPWRDFPWRPAAQRVTSASLRSQSEAYWGTAAIQAPSCIRDFLVRKKCSRWAGNSALPSRWANRDAKWVTVLFTLGSYKVLRSCYTGATTRGSAAETQTLHARLHLWRVSQYWWAESSHSDATWH